jgi:hypothetical protein
MEIEGTTFGTITIDGKTYEHDVIIRLSGEVVKRKKKLSKKYSPALSSGLIETLVLRNQGTVERLLQRLDQIRTEKGAQVAGSQNSFTPWPCERICGRSWWP